MNILAIETSCDDTCCAFFQNNKLIAHNSVNQDKFYQNFTGVVPQLACEQHFSQIDKMIRTTLEQGNCNWTNIDHVAYTKSPGLKPSLFVGKVAAQSIARITGAYLLPINHLLAHSFSVLIGADNLFTNYPVLSLVISGGHTTLFLIHSPDKYFNIAETADDSIGECFDKIGSRMGWNYPGGRNIDDFLVRENALHNFDQKQIPPFPVFRCQPEQLRFSFSGLKSHCIRLLSDDEKMQNKVSFAVALFVAGFKQLQHVIITAVKQYDFSEIWISGGVSASAFLRYCFRNDELLAKYKIRFPERVFSADNAVMVGCFAYNKFKFRDHTSNNPKRRS